MLQYSSTYYNTLESGIECRLITEVHHKYENLICCCLLQYLRYAWVFADLDFSASGSSWDGFTYHLNRSSTDNKKLLNLTITSGPGAGDSVFVVQIAGPWAIEGEVNLMCYSFSRGHYNILEFSSKCTSDKLKI